MNKFEDKNAKKIQEEPIDFQPEIFGRPKSREEIKQEEKARKRAMMESLREARRLAREASKSTPKENRADLLVMGGILLLVLVSAMVLLGRNISQSNREFSYQMSEETPGHFTNSEATPELQDDGITAAINEVYYTNGGHLCVKMTLGNGAAKKIRLDTLEVEVYTADRENLIASGYTGDVSDSYTIPANGTNTYTFYIKPEHVKIADDTLEAISYEITATRTILEE